MGQIIADLKLILFLIVVIRVAGAVIKDFAIQVQKGCRGIRFVMLEQGIDSQICICIGLPTNCWREHLPIILNFVAGFAKAGHANNA